MNSQTFISGVWTGEKKEVSTSHSSNCAELLNEIIIMGWDAEIPPDHWISWSQINGWSQKICNMTRKYPKYSRKQLQWIVSMLKQTAASVRCDIICIYLWSAEIPTRAICLLLFLAYESLREPFDYANLVSFVAPRPLRNIPVMKDISYSFDLPLICALSSTRMTNIKNLLVNQSISLSDCTHDA